MRDRFVSIIFVPKLKKLQIFVCDHRGDSQKKFVTCFLANHFKFIVKKHHKIKNTI